MTKRDYEAIAAIIKERREAAGKAKSGPTRLTIRFTAAAIARLLADYFASANPRFDRNKFLEACGL